MQAATKGRAEPTETEATEAYLDGNEQGGERIGLSRSGRHVTRRVTMRSDTRHVEEGIRVGALEREKNCVQQGCTTASVQPCLD